MKTIILLCLLAMSIGSSDDARADIGKQKCKDPAHFVFNPSSGCIKRPPVRLKTPAESYVNALDALDNDPKRSAALFDAACGAKYAPACLQLGRLYQTGRGRAVQKDAKKALALYERGCELGDGAACQKRGDEARKEGVQREARAWFIKGCDKDDGNACAYLALMLDGGYGGDKNVADAKLKYDKAHKLMEALCPGNGLACFLRGYFLENGYGIKADNGKALDAYRRGCNDSFGDACWKVAKIIDRTKGDPKEAVAMYERACELENADGCSQAAGRLSDEDPKATHPVELAERGCNLDTKECGVLAQMYRLGRGNTPPDQAKATQIFKNTCDAGDHFVCVTYAQRLKDGTGAPKPDLAAAETVLEAACKEDEETACLKLSQWVHDAKTDDARAFRLASRACTLNSARGCFLAAFMVRYDRRGPGGLADPAKKSTEALALAESGCTLGSGNACTEAGELLEEAKELAKALEKFTAGCAATEDQNGNSCIYLTRYLILGTAGAKDKKGGHKAAIRACTFIPERCAWVPGTAEDADDIKLAQLELGPLCDQDQFAACVALGQTLAKGTFEDKRHGREVFGAACRKKHMPACMLEADAIYNGIGGDADKPAGEKLFRRYCDDKDRESCFQVAFYHRQDTDADGGKITLEYADRACTLEHAEGCNLAGFVNYTAMKPVRWDITAAVKYYAKACELGSSSACGNMGEVYRFGLGAPIDQVKALAHYQKSCDSGSQYGCGGLAHYLATGDGGAKKDLAKAEELFKGACEADTIEACVELATLLEKGHGSPGEIARLRLRALQLAEDQGKTNPEYKYFLGTFHRDGMATMKDPVKALVLFGEACDSFDPFGCIAAGKLLVAKGTPPDRERARVYFQRACAAGVDDGCQGIKDAELGPAPSPAVVQAKGCGCHSEVAPGGLAGGAALLGAVVLALRRRRR